MWKTEYKQCELLHQVHQPYRSHGLINTKRQNENNNIFHKHKQIKMTSSNLHPLFYTWFCTSEYLTLVLPLAE